MSAAAGAGIHCRLVPSNLGRLVYFQRPVDEGRQPNHDEEVPEWTWDPSVLWLPTITGAAAALGIMAVSATQALVGAPATPGSEGA
jgi:hypothetical protein